MTLKKKQIAFISVVAVFLLLLLVVLFLVTEEFLITAILHTYLRVIFVAMILVVLHENLSGQLPNSSNKVLISCGIAMSIDLIVIDAIRYVLSKGIATVLFLPACLPVSFMIMMYYLHKDKDESSSKGKKLTFAIGIPLLLLSFYFEILSFLQL